MTETGDGDDPGDATAALARLRAGDRAAWRDLMPLIYTELHALARREMASQPPSHTLQPTALVSEVFLKLCRGHGVDSAQRADFLGLAATAMRSILTDHARAKRTAKRRLPGHAVPISGALDAALEAQWRQSPIDVLTLNELLERYEHIDPVGARLVELRYFAGRSVAEAASVLGIGTRTAQRTWNTARAWLKRELSR